MKKPRLHTLLLGALAVFTSAGVAGADINPEIYLYDNVVAIVSKNGLCSGVMISETWVLTADHCSKILSEPTWVTNYHVESEADYARVPDHRKSPTLPGSRWHTYNPYFFRTSDPLTTRLLFHASDILVFQIARPLAGFSNTSHRLGLYSWRNVADPHGIHIGYGPHHKQKSRIEVRNFLDYSVLFSPRRFRVGDSGGPVFKCDEKHCYLIGITSGYDSTDDYFAQMTEKKAEWIRTTTGVEVSTHPLR